MGWTESLLYLLRAQVRAAADAGDNDDDGGGRVVTSLPNGHVT